MSPCLSLESAMLKRRPCDLERLHRGALPSVKRLHPSFEIDAWSRPMRRIGGDTIAAWPVDDRRIVAFLGDVMGHGTHAAIVASAVRSTLHHLRTQNVCRPADLLAGINRAVLELFPEYFVTACCCLIDTAGTLSCAVAGHPPLLMRSPSGEVRSVASRSLPLGISALPDISEHVLPFDEGASVVAYSDGVSDTLAGGPCLGVEILSNLLRGASAGGPEVIARGIRRAIRRMDRPREDDCSVLVVRRAA